METRTQFDRIVEQVRRQEKKTVIVAAAEETDVLAATVLAQQEHLARILYVGDADHIRQLAEEQALDISGIEIVHETDVTQAGKTAIGFVKEHPGGVMMKGKIATGQILGMVLKDEELKKRLENPFVSHTSIFEWENRLVIFGDAGLNIAPDIQQKRKIAFNMIEAARKLGIHSPRIAFLSAAEKRNPKMPSSVEAAELAAMDWEEGVIAGGPLALDGAIFEKAYQVKGIPSPVEGKADILICPNIETGNVLYKTLAWMLHLDIAGVVSGAAIPCILTSRADSARIKFLSIATTLYLSECDVKRDT